MLLNPEKAGGERTDCGNRRVGCNSIREILGVEGVGQIQPHEITKRTGIYSTDPRFNKDYIAYCATK